MAESSYKENIKQYLGRLDEVQRLSFAPIDALVNSSMGGIDLQILAMVKYADQER